jgi:type III pantothenate kinase
MMNRLLAINVGNARVGLGLFDLSDAGPVPDPKYASAVPAPSAERFAPYLPDGADPDAVLLLSVNPAGAALVADWVRERFGVDPLLFPRDIPAPIANRYEPPVAVGADRLANAAAAYAELRAACIVVDAGTAVTVDAVSAEGAFQGGAILPGAVLMARALTEGTALLPELELAGTESAIGRSTAAAMSSGVLRGLAGAIDRLIADAREELGGAEHVLITGGDAERLRGLTATRMDHRPHLGLAGLALAYRGRDEARE